MKLLYNTALINQRSATHQTTESCARHFVGWAPAVVQRGEDGVIQDLHCSWTFSRVFTPTALDESPYLVVEAVLYERRRPRLRLTRAVSTHQFEYDLMPKLYIGKRYLATHNLRSNQP